MTETFLITRFPPDMKELLKRVTRSRGEDMSSFTRRAILRELAALSYLDADQKKALGVQTHNQNTEDTDDVEVPVQ